MSLFEHTSYPHIPRNVNRLHEIEKQGSGINQRIAIGLTKGVGTMWAAYLFAVLALIGLCGILGWLNPVVILLVTWLSQTFLQLVFLPILSVGQNVLGRHAELMAEEQYQTTKKTYDDIEQLVLHLQVQDEYAIQLAQSIEQIHALLKEEKTQPLIEEGTPV